MNGKFIAYAALFASVLLAALTAAIILFAKNIKNAKKFAKQPEKTEIKNEPYPADTAENPSHYGGGRQNIFFAAPSAKILIVDDVVTNLKVAEGIMSPYQMHIDVCKSGREAINIIRQTRYDVIFMDHLMPEMDGIEAAAAIRSLGGEDGYYKTVPIIALTANAVSGLRDLFLKNGMNDFLAKPIESEDLHNILEKWIPGEKRENYYARQPSEEIGAVEIENVDIKFGLLMSGGKTDNYIKTLDVFYKDGSEKADEIRECLKKNDIKLYTTLVHALKSASLNVGARKLSYSAKALENAGKNELTDFISENTEIFLSDLENLLRSIRAALEKINSDKPSPDGNGYELLRSTLEKLKISLQNMEAGESDNLIKELNSKKWDKTTSDAIKEISNSILLFEYEKAADIIDSLL